MNIKADDYETHVDLPARQDTDDLYSQLSKFKNNNMNPKESPFER